MLQTDWQEQAHRHRHWEDWKAFANPTIKIFVLPSVFKDKHLHKKFLDLKPQAVKFFGGDTYIFSIVQRFAAQLEFQVLGITTGKTYTQW